MAEASLKVLARALTDVFLPRFCIACGTRVGADNPMDLCGACAQAMRPDWQRPCPRCGAAMPEYGNSCPNCHNMRLAMAASTSFGVYSGVLRDRIIDYKFSGTRYLARTFGHMAALAAKDAWPEVAFDAVVAVPLHRARRGERGFDQSRQIAHYAARALGVKDRSSVLRRCRATESQVGLTKTARMRNVREAFVAKGVSGILAALVIDDIMTTGATVSEAARALKRAGVKTVYATVVARTGFEREISPRKLEASV